MPSFRNAWSVAVIRMMFRVVVPEPVRSLTCRVLQEQMLEQL